MTKFGDKNVQVLLKVEVKLLGPTGPIIMMVPFTMYFLPMINSVRIEILSLLAQS